MRDSVATVCRVGYLLPVILLLTSCQSTPIESEALTGSLPEPPPATASPQISDPLIAALRVAGFAQPIEQYTRLSIEVSRAQLDRNSPFQAQQTIIFIERLLQTIAEPSRRIALNCELALLKIDIGQPQEAMLLLEETVNNISHIGDDAERARLLTKLIAAALRLDEGQPVQRAALDQLLIVRESAIRAEALNQIAEYYRTSELETSVAPLLNQAIPAALSIPNPWQRASTLMQTLALFSAIGNERPGRSYIRRMLEVLRTESARTPAEREAAIVAAANAGRAGYIEPALEIVELLGPLSSQVAGFIAVADQVGDDQEAGRIRQRADRGLASLGDNSRRAQLTLALANSYLRAGDSGPARRLADEARNLLAIIRSGAAGVLEEIYADLGLLYFDLGAIESAVQIARTEAQSNGILAPLRVAERLHAGAREIEARELALLAQRNVMRAQDLTQPLFAQQQTAQQQLADGQTLLRLIALLTRLDETEAALQLIEPLDSATELARALITVGRLAGPPFLLSESEQRLIAALAATVPAQ